ncbi:MAG: hypothetical protein HOA58_14160, partial [Rhodospirillaceae bacterium]|nr:hypothetical protein [Rhodospirillaceae bacterium]
MIIKAYNGDHVGATGFFRNRALNETVHDCVDVLDRPSIRVLFHAVSVGAEAYSFVIQRAHRHPGLDATRCDATDIDAEFLRAAGQADYPAQIVQAMTPDESKWFEPSSQGRVRVMAKIRERVRILPPTSYVGFESNVDYDVVFLLNSLLYVDGPSQRRTIDRIARYNTGLLVTTGFHLDRIKEDLGENGYHPVTKNIAAIHDGWTGRRSLEPGFMVPGITHHTPYLPPFSTGPDSEYKYCAV